MKEVIKDYHFALKTVWLFALSFSLWLAVYFVYFSDLLGFIPTLLILSTLAYISFTPMHEASHGNIAGKHKKYKGIERAIGHLSSAPLFIPYPVFKQLHLQHHSFTNVKEWDPDYWVATRNPLILLFKIFTIKPHYYFHAIIKPRTAVKRERPTILVAFGLYALIIGLVHYQTGRGLEFVALWLGSTVLALAFLALVFDWLPHTPHDKIGRYIDTKIIDKSILTYPLLYQNYHLSHHLYPRVPFYDYKKVYLACKEEMMEHKAEII